MFCVQEILAHTEDALQEVLNHFYIVSAHIIEKSPQGKHNVRPFRIISWLRPIKCLLTSTVKFYIGIRGKIHISMLRWTFTRVYHGI